MGVLIYQMTGTEDGLKRIAEAIQIYDEVDPDLGMKARERLKRIRIEIHTMKIGK
jgi:hypothetical protein